MGGIEQLAGVVEHIKPHIVFYLGPVPVTNTVINTWIVMGLIVVVALLTTRHLQLIPRGWQHLPEVAVEFLFSFIDSLLGKEGRRYLPFVGTLFIFILFLNLSWLIPGFKPPTMDLSTTLAFGVTTVITVQILAIRRIGLKNYLRTYVAHGGPVMLPLNIVEELVKIVSLSLRLFGNLYAGEMVVAILLALVPLVVPAAIQLLEVLFGFIQAFIFTVLTITYLQIRTEVTH